MAKVTGSEWSNALENLVREWSERSLDSKRLHLDAHRRYFKLHFLVGIPVVALTAITGTVFFASLSESLDLRVAFYCGMLSVLASALAAVQTFLRYAERSEQHRGAAARYSNLARDIAFVLASAPDERGDASKVIELWKRELATLAEHSPVVAPRGNLDPAELF